MTNRSSIKGVLAALVLALIASSCLFGGGGAVSDAKGMVDAHASDVKPPPPIDPHLSAQPGLVLSTNSITWNKLVHSAPGPGAVVLFVQPNGPSDGKGIARGEVVTAIDGQKVANHEYAIALLRSLPGQKRTLELRARDGKQHSVTIEAKDPSTQRGGRISIRSFLNPMIEANSNDPVLYFLRAQANFGTYVQDLADANRALELEHEFVEALTLKSSLLWDQRLVDTANVTKLANEALAGWKTALDLDPNNTTALTVRSTAVTAFGNGAAGQADADKALQLDDSYPRAYYALALARLQLRQLDSSVGPSASAVRLNPYNLQYVHRLARSFTLVKRKNDCMATVQAVRPFLQSQLTQQQLASEIPALQGLCR